MSWVKCNLGETYFCVKRYIGWNVLGQTLVGQTWLAELLPHLYLTLKNYPEAVFKEIEPHLDDEVQTWFV